MAHVMNNTKLSSLDDLFKSSSVGNDSHKNMLDNLGLNKYDFIRENEKRPVHGSLSASSCFRS